MLTSGGDRRRRCGWTRVDAGVGGHATRALLAGEGFWRGAGRGAARRPRSSSLVRALVGGRGALWRLGAKWLWARFFFG